MNTPTESELAAALIALRALIAKLVAQARRSEPL